MTTKKSKPASLTSSLLARKGEAEPATAPYAIPEEGRQRTSEASAGKGNGNGVGGDLGHALSNLAATASEERDAQDARDSLSENGLHVSPARAEANRSKAEAPASVDAAPLAEPGASEAETAAERPSPETIFAESAVAEEITLDEAVIEASVSDGGADTAPAAGEPETPRAAAPAPGETDESDAAREAARDARLLRFVYAMAALTGIVAIVLYAGGWLREGAKKQTAEAPVAGAPSTTAPPSVQPPQEAAAPAQKADNAGAAPDSGGTPVIPVAPPVAPPMAADGKPGAADSGVTTGGPAKSAAEPAPAETASAGKAGVAPAPAGDGASAGKTPQTESAVPGVSQPSALAEKPAADNSGAAVKDESGKATDAKPVVPTPVPAEPAAPAPVAKEPVRDVPNMRVLAPAIGRPKPAETAPATGTATGSEAPKATVDIPAPAVPKSPPQTAAVPKAAPPKAVTAKPTTAKGSRYLVQLASVSSEAIAKREWARLQKAFPDVFGDRTLVIEKKEIAGRGTFYRVQASGYKSLDEARSVCTGLKAKKQGCLPLKR